ncbi:Hypothetical predicted protein [Mytilus galloprovincialis]|uniref:Uncharacterized protein n=1 Tax=Mytilus galloprovincialis TaxID=29158 RepID=A0A8B6F2H5_MYTGA|nr:Hypothetical predicted protein [Mytilus galloprovincialis]
MNWLWNMFKKDNNNSPTKPVSCGTTGEQFKAVAIGKVDESDVKIDVNNKGLTLEYKTDSTYSRHVYDEYTSDKYEFIRENGSNPKVTQEEGDSCIEFRLLKNEKSDL